jgi:hypothetical protein
MSSASTTVVIQQRFLSELASIKVKYANAKVKQITGDRLTNVTRFEAFQSRLKFFARCVRDDAAYNKNEPSWVALLLLTLDFYIEVYEFISTL